MTLNQDELATVLVALRLYMRELRAIGGGEMQKGWSQFSECAALPLTYDEVDALADRLNEEESPARVVCEVKQGFVTCVYSDAAIEARVIDLDMQRHLPVAHEPLAKMSKEATRLNALPEWSGIVR